MNMLKLQVTRKGTQSYCSKTNQKKNCSYGVKNMYLVRLSENYFSELSDSEVVKINK